MSNKDVGGRLVEMAETEYMVRGLGYIKSIEDLNSIPVGVDANGTPIRLRDVANVQIGPELRRGVVDLNGEGEVAGGVVIMRFGENALPTGGAGGKRFAMPVHSQTAAPPKEASRDVSACPTAGSGLNW